MSGITWTDERIAELRRMWGLGISAGKIALTLGCTRNAVIGKVYRLELPSRQTGLRFPPWRGRGWGTTNPRNSTPPRPEPKPRSRKSPATSMPFRPRIVATVAVAYDGPGKRFADLESQECRYPSGDGAVESYRFCAKPVQVGLPYCLTHADLCYVRVSVAPIEQGVPVAAISTTRAKEVADA